MMQTQTFKYPFIIISLCLICGIFAGKYVIHFPYSLWLTIIFFNLSLISSWTKRTTVLHIMIFLTLICASSLRMHLVSEVRSTDHISAVKIDKAYQYEGLVIDYQYKKDQRNKYIISIENISLPDSQVSVNGNIILYTKKIYEKYRYGDKIQVRGSLITPTGKRNPGQFDYRQYLINQNIFYVSQVSQSDSIRILANGRGNWFIKTIIIPLREYCQHLFSTYIDEETAGLMMALILGEKQNLDQEMIQNFKTVGVVHVLAISGLHVGFIITFVSAVKRLNKIQTLFSAVSPFHLYLFKSFCGNSIPESEGPL